MANRREASASSAVDEYIRAFEPGKREALERMRTLIRRASPDAVESMAYGMPAYKLDGRPLAYFAGHSGHLGLYALPGAIEAFRERLKGFKTSKGTIQLPYGSDLPEDLIDDILKFRVGEIRTGRRREDKI